MTNPVDFRARQVQVNKIIANDPDGPTNKILIYGNTANTDNRGGVNSGVFPQSASIALDTFLYVSGAVNSKTDSGAGIAVFGGDVVVSGSLYQGRVDVKGGAFSHAEGRATIAFEAYSHAEGRETFAGMQYSHTEGYKTSTSTAGQYSHAEGYETNASGLASHAEGTGSVAVGNFSHTEGYKSYTFDHGVVNQYGQYAHTEGQKTSACGDASHAEGCETAASGAFSHAEGFQTVANGGSSHAEGAYTYTFNNGVYNQYGQAAHTEGQDTSACGDASHAEGNTTKAIGFSSHAEGYQTIAFGTGSHAEGYQTIASGSHSHAEGKNCYTFDHGASPTQTGEGAHVEGEGTSATGNYSHAEGYQTATSGAWSHAGGIGTMAYAQGQTVFGQYNINFNTTSTFVIGAGLNDSLREDLFAVEARAVNVAAHLVLSGGIRHHAIYTENTANGGFGGAETHANLTKRNYIVISDTSLGDKTVELPRITDSTKDIGLTVVIRQDDVDGSTNSCNIIPHHLNVSYKIYGFNYFVPNLKLNFDDSATPGPDLSGNSRRSVTLTYMGVLGFYYAWVVVQTSVC